MKLWHVYLLLMNAVALILCAVDKQRARQRRFRVPEGTLMLCAALGGSAGLLLGIFLLRHKTLHKKFTLGVPLILLLQLAGVYFLFAV